eukprot:RCo038427
MLMIQEPGRAIERESKRRTEHAQKWSWVATASHVAQRRGGHEDASFRSPELRDTGSGPPSRLSCRRDDSRGRPPRGGAGIPLQPRATKTGEDGTERSDGLEGMGTRYAGTPATGRGVETETLEDEDGSEAATGIGLKRGLSPPRDGAEQVGTIRGGASLAP